MIQDSLFDLERSEPRWPDRPRYLLSFAYLDDEQVNLCRKYDVDLVLDSGAFTTAASGKQMDHDGYLDWLTANHDAITFAMSYDVIGDHHASAVNHDYAQERIGDVVKLVPTFHLGSPMTELDRLCRTHDLVSIGGAVAYAKDQRQLMTVFRQIHRVAAEHGTHLHALGMTGNRVIHGFPWYSVDSSGWLGAVRFPRLALAEPDGRLTQLEHGWKLTRHEQTLARRFNLNPDLMQTPGWSLKEVVGPELALERRMQVMTACGRAYMWAEAAKAAHQPDHPIRIYLSGNSGSPGGAVQMVANAHTAGPPYSVEQSLAERHNYEEQMQ